MYTPGIIKKKVKVHLYTLRLLVQGETKSISPHKTPCLELALMA
jgi:hypothetical protein